MAIYRYKNSKVWWMDFIFDGYRVRESTKSRNKKLAEDIERKRRSELESGRMGIKKRGRPRLFTLASDDYLEAKRAVLSERSFIIERSNLKHLLPAFGARLVSDIDAADIDGYQKARQRAGAAAKTINLEVGTLRALLLRNRLWEPIRQDVRMLKVEDTPGKALTHEEEDQLLAACRESRSRGLYPSFVLALNTGMRSAELRWLQWKQIDLRAGSIRVGRSKTAAGAGRTIPLNRRALEVLKDWAARFEDRDSVYEVLQKADTVGMFQIESRAQMASLPRNYPTKFYDLVVQVAIIRPGPIVGKMMHPYMRRRQKKEEVTYPHPSLEPVLERTLGVPLFQEQLLRIAMTVANFSGAEAEELRRAVGMRRSWERMKDLEVKLRAGMTANGINAKIQDTIVENISSFALYGFPESHAASFALIAYASAYFKVKYLAAFTCAILNNQPMGFYAPAVLVKDAQRHGLRVKPLDVQISDWPCTVEQEPDGSLSLRMGLRYAKGLRRESAYALVASRLVDGPFRSAEDLALRIPSLNRKELTLLARIGALNKIDAVEHRRDALWQMERAGKMEGSLLRQSSEWLREDSPMLPLQRMTMEERLVADYSGTGLTVDKHPMHHRRPELRRQGVLSAQELRRCRDGELVRTAGCVIARQRPGTAKGFIFLSMEDETGIANVIVTPDLYERQRLIVTRSKFILAEGPLQNQGGVIHVKAMRLQPLINQALEIRSHDFY